MHRLNFHSKLWSVFGRLSWGHPSSNDVLSVLEGVTLGGAPGRESWLTEIEPVHGGGDSGGFGGVCPIGLAGSPLVHKRDVQI